MWQYSANDNVIGQLDLNVSYLTDLKKKNKVW